MKVFLNYVKLVVTVLISLTICGAQDCATTAPVSVVDRNFSITQSLSVSDFNLIGPKDARITNATVDRSPKRILLIIDNGKGATDVQRKIEMAILNKLLGPDNQRADLFAVSTVHGTKQFVPFGAASDLLKKATEIVSTQSSVKKRDTFASVLEAVPEFGSPQFGDTIFLITANPDPEEGDQEGRIRRELNRRGVRLFGASMQDGPRGEGGYYTAGSVDYIPDRNSMNQDLKMAASNSGGYLYVENANPENKKYDLTDQKLKSLLTAVWQMYGMIAEPYRVEISGKAAAQPYVKDVKLDLVEKAKGAPNSKVVLYSREIPGCNSQAAAK